MNYARIKNGVVVETAAQPSKMFHPILAAEFVEIPDDVEAGYTFDGTNYAPPVLKDPEPIKTAVVKQVSISPVDFKFLFTLSERVKIKELRASDPVLDDFYSLLDDPRLLVVNLDDPRIIEGVEYAVSALFDQGLIEDKEQRIGEILGGIDAVSNA